MRQWLRPTFDCEKLPAVLFFSHNFTKTQAKTKAVKLGEMSVITEQYWFLCTGT